MKFIKKNNFYYTDYIFSSNLKNFNNDSFIEYYYDKKKLLKKNYLNFIRPGLTKNKRKNSIIRDYNYSLLNQYININQRKGKKSIFLKNINLMVDNLFFCFNEFLQEFEKHDNYFSLFFLHNSNSYYCDIDNLLNDYIKNLESIFEIRTIKNNKKLNLPNKYTHEIIYLPKKRRLKYVLKSLSLYKENFKKYELWERIFWSFFLTFINKDKSAIAKRRTYIYIKSMKFFKKKIKK